MGFAKKDKCAEDGPEAGLRKTQWGSLFSSLLCSSKQHVREQDKRIAELTRPDVEARLNPTPITGFRKDEDETELQWALRLNDMTRQKGKGRDPSCGRAKLSS